jgi:hypothetical protein
LIQSPLARIACACEAGFALALVVFAIQIHHRARGVGIPLKPISHSAGKPITSPEESDQASSEATLAFRLWWKVIGFVKSE